MKRWYYPLTGLLSLVLAPLSLSEIETSGYIEGELRYFPSKPLFEQQSSFFSSVAAEPEISWKNSEENQYITFKPFARVDSSDGNRTHADIRELSYLYAGSGWQIEAGINKVYWGVAESAHLVDIINQTDVVESFSGEEKLGQPLIGLGLEQDFGNLDIYILPYFREKQLSSDNERYQISLPGFDKALPIDYDEVLYESASKESHVDLAVRWAQSFDDLDLAISAFHGTDREGISIISSVANPQRPNPSEVNSITMYYQQMTQLGLELQYLYEDWAFKFEGTIKDQNTGNYGAYVTGFEYTFSDASPWGQDIGILLEYLWNNRKSVDITEQSLRVSGVAPESLLGYRFALDGSQLSPFENDIFLGTRFNLNNIDSTEFIAGIIYDLETGTNLTTFEGSTRIGDSVRISLNMYFLSNVDSDSSFYFSRRDDLIELKTAWYF